MASSTHTSVDAWKNGRMHAGGAAVTVQPEILGPAKGAVPSQHPDALTATVVACDPDTDRLRGRGGGTLWVNGRMNGWMNPHTSESYSGENAPKIDHKKHANIHVSTKTIHLNNVYQRKR